MTKEEAKEQLIWYFDSDDGLGADLKTRQAFNIVVKAPEQEPRWIPVSERLPEVADCYAITRQIGSDLIVDVCFFDRTNTWHHDSQINYERNYLTNIIAWMPLPQPYKVEREGKE